MHRAVARVPGPKVHVISNLQRLVIKASLHEPHTPKNTPDKGKNGRGRETKRAEVEATGITVIARGDITALVVTNGKSHITIAVVSRSTGMATKGVARSRHQCERMLEARPREHLAGIGRRL